jgi:hypothetical protein
MIILPTTKPITWDSTDAGILQSFLESPVGQKVLCILHDTIPPLLDGSDVNKTLVQSGRVSGAQLIFDSLVSLIVEVPVELQPPAKQEESYPDLENEAAWEKYDAEQPH